MEVILSQDVDKLGKAGAIIKVREGFARNYLIPNKLAIPVTSANIKKLEENKLKKNMQLEKAKKESEDLKIRLENISLTLTALTKEEEEKLYGSIISQDIVNALKEEGFEIDKNLIVLEEPIKSLGIYEIPIKLHPEVTAKVKVWVVKK